MQLVDDAEARGWEREVDRHQLIVARIVGPLEKLGESHESPPSADNS